MDAQKQAYGDGLDEKCLHPYMWIQKSHYYGSTLYNYPYAFGELLSRGLYARYLREGKHFVPKYKDFLYATPVATAEDAAKVAGIDLTDRAFWQDAMGMLEEKVEQFCALAEKER
jgi:oligoendopeptidase F